MADWTPSTLVRNRDRERAAGRELGISAPTPRCPARVPNYRPAAPSRARFRTSVLGRDRVRIPDTATTGVGGCGGAGGEYGRYSWDEGRGDDRAAEGGDNLRGVMDPGEKAVEAELEARAGGEAQGHRAGEFG